MYPFFRLSTVLLKANFRPKISFTESAKLRLRAGLSDIDILLELNNARHLVAFELARWDFSMRCGLLGLVARKRWGLTVGGASVRYRRRVPFGAKYEVSCQPICHDGRWFYLLQEITCNNQICSSGLMKVGVTDHGKLVPALQVMEELGAADTDFAMPEWVKAWIDAEGLRPWPKSSEGRSS